MVRTLVAAVLAVLLASGPANAQDIRDVTLRSLSNAGIGYYDQGAVYVGPYGFQVGSDPGAPLWDFFCVDFSRRVSRDVTFDAYFTSLASGDLVGTTYRADLSTYLMAAYLTRRFYDTPQSEWGSIHAAIWRITGSQPEVDASGDPEDTYGVPGVDYATGGDAAWSEIDGLVAEARANYTSLNPERWYVVTDVNRENQEFLTYTTPEPTSMILLGTGLAGMAWFRRRRDDGVTIEDEEPS